MFFLFSENTGSSISGCSQLEERKLGMLKELKELKWSSLCQCSLKNPDATYMNNKYIKYTPTCFWVHQSHPFHLDDK